MSKTIVLSFKHAEHSRVGCPSEIVVITGQPSMKPNRKGSGYITNDYLDLC